jgi:hypothetical protein
MLKKIFGNPWIVGIGTGVIATIISTLITSNVTNQNIWISLGVVFIFIWNLFKILILFRIPIWLLISISILLVFVFKIISTIKSGVFKTYTTEWYKNWQFTWNVNLSFRDRSWSISNLRPICTCGCELSRYEKNYDQHEWYIYCPACGKKYQYCFSEDYEDAQKYVEHIMDKKVKEQNAGK